MRQRDDTIEGQLTIIESQKAQIQLLKTEASVTETQVSDLSERVAELRRNNKYLLSALGVDDEGNNERKGETPMEEEPPALNKLVGDSNAKRVAQILEGTPDAVEYIKAGKAEDLADKLAGLPDDGSKVAILVGTNNVLQEAIPSKTRLKPLLMRQKPPREMMMITQ